MAIIYSYPRIGTLDLQDLMIISDVQTEGNPTKSVTLSQLTAFIKGTPTGGLGTTNYIPKWIDGPNSILGDSPIFTIDGGAGLKQAVLTDGYRFVVDRDAATTVGDPEYAITQNGVNKTSFGWDDDGGGFGFIYNWEGKGFKLGGAALYPQFEILTDPDIKNISFADLYMAPTGAGPSVGSNVIVFRGVDDLGTELDAARIFTLDSAINPSGQDLYLQNADDNGVLRTGLFIDAFQQVAIAKGTATAQLDVGGSFNVDTNVIFSGYGSGTRTGTATYNLSVDTSGNVIEEPLTSGTVTGSGAAEDITFWDGVTSITGDSTTPFVYRAPGGGGQPAGRVGLGTSTPNFKMDISGGDLRFENNDGIRFGGTGSNNTLWRIFTTSGPVDDFSIGSSGSNPYLTISQAALPVGQVRFDSYGSGSFTGTAAFGLSVDASGNIIETTGGGGIGGGGTLNFIPRFSPNGTTLDDSNISDDGATIETNAPMIFNDAIDVLDVLRDVGGSAGTNNQLLTSASGTGVEWRSPQDNTLIGYKSVQVFQWTAGNPVAYTNFIIGGAASGLPFDATPLVETGTYTGTAANFAWTCVNQAGGTATQFAEFTLGANGTGTWEISTAQQWFDQNQFLEVNVSIAINGTVFEVINERVNDGAGDRLFYGSLVREFSAGDLIVCSITFANGTGSNPFPAATNNRPIEITFNKLV